MITANGLFRPFALVDGRAVATWRITADTIEIEPLEPISETDNSALRDEAADVGRFLSGAAARETA